MLVKIFILGRPGSGKSSAARRIEKLSRRLGLGVARINDYDILEKLYREDGEGKYFKPTDEYAGFDVTDFSVLDKALEKAGTEAKKATKATSIVVIEFARNNYIEALKRFPPSFLKNSYFLFIDTDVETCIQRIRQRVAFPTTPDDHFVSEQILRQYYSNQVNPFSTQSTLNIDMSRVSIIDNRGSRRQYDGKIRTCFNSIVEREAQRKEIRVLVDKISAPLRNVDKLYAPLKKFSTSLFISSKAGAALKEDVALQESEVFAGR